MRDGWESRPLGDVLRQIHRPVPVSDLEEVRYAGVRWYTEGVYERAVVPARDIKAKALNRIHTGDIVYNRMWATKSSFGVVGKEADGCLVTNDFPIFNADPSGVLPSYIGLLFHWQRFRSAASVSATGTTERRRLNERDFIKIQVPLPPLPEQRRIVDLIGALDDTIAAGEEAEARARDAAQRLRDVVFTRVATEVPDIAARDMFDMLLGRQKSARQSVGEHVIPYLRAANVSSDGFVLQDVQTMNFSPSEQEKYCLRENDVMLVEGGSLGQSALWKAKIEGPVGFDKHVIRLRAVTGRSLPEYALQWTKWAYESGAFDALATGITIRALGFGRASSMPVPHLGIDEQRELVDHLMVADEIVALHQKAVKSLRTLRSNLLTVLLSGEHEIPDSYDELLGETE